MAAANRKIALLGAGKIGESLLAGLLSSGWRMPDEIVATGRREERIRDVAGRHGVRTTLSNAEAVAGAGLVVIAVKPQDFDTLLGEVGGLLTPEQTVLSVAAAIPTALIESRIAPGVPVVRAMPNAPAVVHEGIAGVCAGAHAGDEHLALAEDVLSHLGAVVRVPESYMDAVTAVSGSGPAYFALLAEAMIEAGILLGLSREISTQLVVQTMLGTARLLRDEKMHPVELREGVTSPGGTTIRAIQELENAGGRAAPRHCSRRGRQRRPHRRHDAEASVRARGVARRRLEPRRSVVGRRALRAARRRELQLRDGEARVARSPRAGPSRRPPNRGGAGQGRRRRRVRGRARVDRPRPPATRDRPRRTCRFTLSGQARPRGDGTPRRRHRAGARTLGRPSDADAACSASRRRDPLRRRRRVEGRRRPARVRLRAESGDPRQPRPRRLGSHHCNPRSRCRSRDRGLTAAPLYVEVPTGQGARNAGHRQARAAQGARTSASGAGARDARRRGRSGLAADEPGAGPAARRRPRPPPLPRTDAAQGGPDRARRLDGEGTGEAVPRGREGLPRRAGAARRRRRPRSPGRHDRPGATRPRALFRRGPVPRRSARAEAPARTGAPDHERVPAGRTGCRGRGCGAQ